MCEDALPCQIILQQVDIRSSYYGILIRYYLRAYRQTKIRAHSGAYFEAVEADRIAVEASLNESSRRMDAEREAEGSTDDHDDRKLKKSERLRLVIKNKARQCCVHPCMVFSRTY